MKIPYNTKINLSVVDFNCECGTSIVAAGDTSTYEKKQLITKVLCPRCKRWFTIHWAKNGVAILLHERKKG